ncbi:hypothetical protein Alg215_01732 [Pyrenophora tritici-repentis]|nr:hypothetical protein Alg215_01732 [Pyrenophora tritici-repentis]
MTEPPPTLLTLPRELRDQIFSYLYHEKRFKWAGESPDNPSYFDLCSLALWSHHAKIYLHNSPQLSVLLTHSQLYAEHMPDLAVSIYPNISYRGMWPVIQMHPCNPKNAIIEAFLRQAKVISLFFRVRDQESWKSSHEIVNAFSNIALEMKILRISTQIAYTHSLESVMGNEDIDLKKMKQLGPPFITPLPKLTDLPLAQHCRAYRIQPYMNWNFPLPWEILAGHCEIDLMSVSMSVYGREVTAKHKWTTQGCLDALPLPLEESLNVENFTHHGWSPEVAERLCRYPLEMLEWEEVDIKESKK